MKEKSEKKAKGLYFEARIEIALPGTEPKFYGALKIIAEHGFKAAAGPLGVMARFPSSTLELAQEALTNLGQAIRADGCMIKGYALSEVFTDSGSFDTLKLLDVPPHADKPSAAV